MVSSPKKKKSCSYIICLGLPDNMYIELKKPKGYCSLTGVELPLTAGDSVFSDDSTVKEFSHGKWQIM